MSKKIGWIAMGLMLAGLSAPAAVSACEITDATLGCGYDAGCHRNAYTLTWNTENGCEDPTARIERKCGNGPWTTLDTSATSPWVECAPTQFCATGFVYRITSNLGGDSVIVGPTTCN